ncbi:uncharacterized protein LOC124445015 [Xenia sp. Carnegie-2017]|uniref:uncharacterized protein LOC124445015 n=1 Tax=Xenia sp. Carnegie-2017 TaxID=2897299 RepID=UPI001F0408F5|nr:uncharacterized protein LOC124445015 [Xenia sp. Carnegie-2017]
MAEDCEKEKHISVLVEQAFPTCIMVSYKDEGKTYRGVLLDESSHIVTRASLTRTIEDKDSSNLCLTSSRAVTCSSSDLPKCESRTPQDKHDDDIDHSSSEHQGRSLIKSSCLRKRQIRTTQTGQPVTNSENMTDTRRLKSPEQKISLMKSLKRKRSKPSTRSGTSSFENGQEDLEQSATNDNSQHFPVLKLKRTTGTSNNYVALISEKSQKVNAETGKESPYVQSNKSFDHRHNTRYRGRKRTDEKSNHQEMNVKSEEPNEKEILSNGDEIVEVYTKEPSALINENGSQLGKHVNINQCYAKRGVQPRNHNVEMRVGEIIWGKFMVIPGGLVVSFTLSVMLLRTSLV